MLFDSVILLLKSNKDVEKDISSNALIAFL